MKKRLEEIEAKALKKVNNDRYILSLIVAARAKELSEGDEPLIEVDKNQYKFTDIALMEIYEDKLDLEEIVNKK
ncbi:MAG: DNA-directed RNA polymerase subunit omega [Epsilonproteobacteria bacterium]|nr:DNA-directed RNA polymerase subunit omega [Campylobacterota bacterium]